MAETPVPSDESGAQGSGDVPSGSAGGAAFGHPRISGGNGLTLEQAVVVQAVGLEMGLMLMQLWLEQMLGLKGRDWLPGTERWVDSANHAPRTVRAVGVELRDGSQREYYFDLGSATGFGREPGAVVGAGAGQGPVVETVAVTTPVAGLTLPPVPQSKMVMAPPPVPRTLPVALPPPPPVPVPVSLPVAPEKTVDSLLPELSEILNQKEKLRGGALPARRGQAGWGWWLTLTGCVAAGAAGVVWWNPDQAALTPGAKPASTLPVVPPEKMVAPEKAAGLPVNQEEVAGKADVSSSAPLPGRGELTEATTAEPKSNATSPPGKALSPAMESLLDEVVQAGNAALEEEIAQVVKGAPAKATVPAVPAAAAEAKDEPAPHSSNGGLSMAPVTPLEPAAGTQRPTSQREMQERLLLRVQRWGDAAVRGDCRAVVECMPAGIVQTMGGVEALTSRMEEAMGTVTRLKAQPVDFHVGEVSAFAQDPAGLLAVVPTYTKTAPLPNKTTGVLRGYLIGISEDHGATWSLIDHELMEEKMALSVFPELGRVADLPKLGVDWITPADKEDWAPGGATVQARLEQVRGKKVGGTASSVGHNAAVAPVPTSAAPPSPAPAIGKRAGAEERAAQARRCYARIMDITSVPEGRRDSADWQELIALLRKGAALGHVTCQVQLGMALDGRYDQVEADYPLSRLLLEKAAAAGDADAQGVLAYLYLSGTEVPKDLNRARYLAVCGARQGSRIAQFVAAKSYCQYTDDRDYAEGWKWYTLAGPVTEEARLILEQGKKDYPKKYRDEGEARARAFKAEPQPVPEMGEPCPEALESKQGNAGTSKHEKPVPPPADGHTEMSEAVGNIGRTLHPVLPAEMHPWNQAVITGAGTATFASDPSRPPRPQPPLPPLPPALRQVESGASGSGPQEKAAPAAPATTSGAERPSSPQRTRPRSTDELQQRVLLRVQAWGGAVERGDYKAMVECMPAGMVKRMGGVKDLSGRVKAGMEMLATMGVKPLDFRVGEVSPIVQGKARLLTVVPTYMRFATQADRVAGVIRGYLIGLSEDGGQTWALVDNEVVNEETAASLFPELVRGTSLPETRVLLIGQARNEGKELQGMTVLGRLQQVRERIKKDSAAGLYRESGGVRKE